MEPNLSLGSRPPEQHPLRLIQDKDLIYLILQLLDEEKYSDSVHMLEKESGLYFNEKHFENSVLSGDWSEAENYVSAFIRNDTSPFSVKILFDIRKHKFLEALDRGDRAKALEILTEELRVFEPTNPQLFKEMTELLTLNNYRESPKLSSYGDTKWVRGVVLSELKKVIAYHPLLKDKLKLPAYKSNVLRSILNISKLGPEDFLQ